MPNDMLAYLDGAFTATDLEAFGFHYPDADFAVREGHDGTLLAPMTDAAHQWLALHVAEFIAGDGCRSHPASVRRVREAGHGRRPDAHQAHLTRT